MHSAAPGASTITSTKMPSMIEDSPIHTGTDCNRVFRQNGVGGGALTLKAFRRFIDSCDARVPWMNSAAALLILYALIADVSYAAFRTRKFRKWCSTGKRSGGGHTGQTTATQLAELAKDAALMAVAKWSLNLSAHFRTSPRLVQRTSPSSKKLRGSFP